MEILEKLLSCIRTEKVVFIAGMPENIKDFQKVFDVVFLLDAEKDVIEKRLRERTNNHFAKKDDERAFMFTHTQELLDQLENPLRINANEDPETVAKTILSSLHI